MSSSTTGGTAACGRRVGDAPPENLPTTDEMEALLRKVLVAEVLGTAVGTVKSRVYYALCALRVALEERGVTA